MKDHKLLFLLFLFGAIIIATITYGSENCTSKELCFEISPSKSVFQIGEPINLKMNFASNVDNVLLFKNSSFGMQCSISYIMHFLIISNKGRVLKYYNSGFPMPLIPDKNDFIKLNKGDQYNESFDLRKYYRQCIDSDCSKIYLDDPKVLNWEKGNYKIRAIYMYTFDKVDFWRGSVVSNEINIIIN